MICPAVYLPNVTVAWKVVVGEGGSGGTVRPVVEGVVGDPVELPATPGTYTFPAPHILSGSACRELAGIVQTTGGHAIVTREDATATYLDVRARRAAGRAHRRRAADDLAGHRARRRRRPARRPDRGPARPARDRGAGPRGRRPPARPGHGDQRRGHERRPARARRPARCRAPTGRATARRCSTTRPASTPRLAPGESRTLRPARRTRPPRARSRSPRSRRARTSPPPTTRRRRRTRPRRRFDLVGGGEAAPEPGRQGPGARRPRRAHAGDGGVQGAREDGEARQDRHAGALHGRAP